jgi:hypothetical protein
MRKLLYLVALSMMALVLYASAAMYSNTANAPTQAAAGPTNIHYSVRLGYPSDMSPTTVQSRIDKAKDAGATMMQVQVAWDDLEPTADDGYQWAFLDDAVNRIEASGLEAFLEIQGSPRWATPGCNDRQCPPRGSTQLGYFRDLMKDVAGRYGARVDSYEIWNEPNEQSFWAGGAPNPADYAAMLRAAYLGAKVDAGVTAPKIVGGVLSLNDVGYLSHMYTALKSYSDAASNNNFFDELGVHPYSFVPVSGAPGTPLAPDAPYDSRAELNSTFGPKNANFTGFDKMQAEMARQGDGHKKMFLGEYGFSTSTSWMAPLSDSTRADWLKKAYPIAAQKGTVSGLGWYTFFDPDRGFEIIVNGTETQTFAAFREITP